MQSIDHVMHLYDYQFWKLQEEKWMKYNLALKERADYYAIANRRSSLTSTRQAMDTGRRREVVET